MTNGKSKRLALRICLLGFCGALIGCGGGGDGGGNTPPPPDTQPVADQNSGPDLAPAFLARQTLQLSNSGTGARTIRFDPNGTTWQEVSNGATTASGTYLYQKNGAGQNALVTLNESSGPVTFRLTYQTTSSGFYVYLSGRTGSASFTMVSPGNTTSGSTAGNTTSSTAGSTAGNTNGNTDGSTNGNTTGTTDGSSNGNTSSSTNGSTNGNTTGSTNSGTTNGSTTGSTNGSTTGESLSGLTMRGTRTFTSTGPTGQTHTYTFNGSNFHDSDPPEESDGEYTFIRTGANTATLQLRYTSPEDFAGDFHEMNLTYNSQTEGNFTSTYRRHDGTDIQINGTFIFLGGN